MDVLRSYPGYWGIWPDGPGTYGGHVKNYAGDVIVSASDKQSRAAVERALRDGIANQQEREVAER